MLASTAASICRTLSLISLSMIILTRISLRKTTTTVTRSITDLKMFFPRLVEKSTASQLRLTTALTSRTTTTLVLRITLVVNLICFQMAWTTFSFSTRTRLRTMPWLKSVPLVEAISPGDETMAVTVSKLCELELRD